MDASEIIPEDPADGKVPVQGVRLPPPERRFRASVGIVSVNRSSHRARIEIRSWHASCSVDPVMRMELSTIGRVLGVRDSTIAGDASIERRPDARDSTIDPATEETNMSLVRWDPFRELEEMSGRLNRLFANPVARRATGDGRDALTMFDWSPSVDISETPKEFRIKAELPEVKKEDVKVSVEHGVLRLEGERRQESEEKDTKFHRVERSYGSFLRTFALPDNVDESKVQAEFKNGILDVRLPKSENAENKAIEVKVS